ncbi:hypothetical protein TcYC6_0095590 [Trypanosoma cruzi]|nr:hypothetical protein TcYC6_0095590 [Trypanosoma cruzi]
MEEDRGFCAFDVTTWPTRIWNEGASGVVCDLRCAYQCWQQEDEEKVNLAFDNLFEWIGVLEGGQDRTDRFMNLRRPLMNTFRMQLTIASDPGIRLSKLRARLYTAASPDGHLCEGSPIQSATSHQSSQAAHRTADAPPDLSNRPTQSSRRETGLFANDARLWYDESPTALLWASCMRKANEVAREMWAPSTWEQRMPPAGRFTTFKPHARTAERRGELCSLFDGNRGGAIDPTAAHQDAAVHVSNVCDPAEYDGFGATKNRGAI